MSDEIKTPEPVLYEGRRVDPSTALWGAAVHLRQEVRDFEAAAIAADARAAELRELAKERAAMADQFDAVVKIVDSGPEAVRWARAIASLEGEGRIGEKT